MKDVIQEAYDTLKEYDFIMPYDTAWGFVWTHLACFNDRYRPTHKKHFFPFEKYHDITFFYIDNIVDQLKSQLSERTLTEAGFPPIVLSVMYIFIIGLTDDEAQRLTWIQDFGRNAMEPILRDYNYSHHFISEIMSFNGEVDQDYNREPMQPEIGVDFDFSPRLHKLKLNRKFFAQYDIPITNDADNLLVYTIKIID